MSSDPWFKFYPSDWLSGTRGLTPAETGVYVTLICMLYENDGKLPRNDARLARRCGCTAASFKKILKNLLLEDKISDIVDNDQPYLVNFRVQKELTERGQRVQKSVDAAHQKWRTYRQKNQLNQTGNSAPAHNQQSASTANNQNQNQSHYNKNSRGFSKSETALQRLSRSIGHQASTTIPQSQNDDGETT